MEIHPKLIEWGFMDYVDRQWKERIFSEVAGTYMTKVGKVFSDLRDQLCMLHLDDFGRRQLLHAIRQSVCFAAMASQHSSPATGGWTREKWRDY